MDLADDLVSQIFLKALHNLPNYQFRGLPFSAWLYRIAANEVNQYFRDETKTRHVSIDSGGLVEIIESMAEAEEAEPLAYETCSDALILSFQSLTSEEIEFIEMRFFEKLSFRDLAFVCDITENYAKVRMHRLLKKLKNIMEQSLRKISS